MKKITKIFLLTYILSGFLFFQSLNAKTLIVYFSWGGNTKRAADMIKHFTNADIFEIKRLEEYPKTYSDLVAEYREELKRDSLPKLSSNINNLESYDTVILCYPLWGNSIPIVVKQLLSTHNFSGKKIAPLCTHGGGGLGISIDDIASLSPNSIMLEGLGIYGSRVNGSENNIKSWLEKINIL